MSNKICVLIHYKIWHQMLPQKGQRDTIIDKWNPWLIYCLTYK